MDRKTILRALEELENEFQAYNWRVNDIYIWPILKTRIFFNAFSKKPEINHNIQYSENKKKTFSLNYLTKLISLIGLIKFSLWDEKRLLNKIKNQDVVFLAYPVHRVNLKSTWYNRFFDGFIDYLNKINKKSILLELQTGTQPYFENNYNNENRIEIDNLKLAFFKKYKLQTESLCISQLPENYELFFAAAEQKFGEQVMRQFEKKKLLKFIKKFLNLKQFYKYLLEKAKPKAGLVLSLVSIDVMAFIAACHELKIPSADVQHGLQGEDTIGYNWLNVPNEGYEVLPDYFWNWSEQDAAQINKWATLTYKHKAIAGGNPWLYTFKEMDKNISELFKDELNSIKLNRSDAKYIIFSLQPTATNPFPDWLIKAIELSPDNYKWWLRLHPRRIDQEMEIRKKLALLPDQSKYDIDSCTSIPLPLLLKHSSIHITFYSTVIKEAKEFKVPSVFLEKTAACFFKEEFENGLAYPFYKNSPEELIDLIRSLSEKTISKVLIEQTDVDSIDVLNTLLK